MAETPSQRLLTDTQLGELMRLLAEVDSVELKLTVPDHQHRAAIRALDLDPLDAQIRQVFFFDTPDLQLDKAGVVVRARRVQGRADDTTVKLRPVVPAEVSEELRNNASFGIEVDVMPNGFVCSGSLVARRSRSDTREAAAGRMPLQKLYSKDQRKLFADSAPEGVTWDHLQVLGPIFVLKLKMAGGDLPEQLVCEMWLYPDGSRIFELSTKCAPREAFDTAMRLRLFLADHGIESSTAGQTKTRAALDFFSAELAAATAG